MQFGLRALFLSLLLVVSTGSFAQEANSEIPEIKTEVAQVEGVPSDLMTLIASRTEEPSVEAATATAGQLAAPTESSSLHPAIAVLPVKPEPQRNFDWAAATRQSGTFLGLQLSGLIWKQPWMRYELRGKFFPDWINAVKGLHGWDDGDPHLDNYVGHPLQGAITGYIQVQNDRKGRMQEFGKNPQYWKSRLKAMAWSAAYSTQFELGPVSEASIGNTGGYVYFGRDGKTLVNGLAYVDLVVTPLGGMGWMVGEDALDKYFIKKVEHKMPRFLGKVLRAGLNPARSASNMLRWKAPWYRDTRDGNPDAPRP